MANAHDGLSARPTGETGSSYYDSRRDRQILRRGYGEVTGYAASEACPQVTASPARPGGRSPASGPAGPASNPSAQQSHPHAPRTAGQPAPGRIPAPAGGGNQPTADALFEALVMSCQGRMTAPCIDPSGHYPAVYEFPLDKRACGPVWPASNGQEVTLGGAPVARSGSCCGGSWRGPEGWRGRPLCRPAVSSGFD